MGCHKLLFSVISLTMDHYCLCHGLNYLYYMGTSLLHARRDYIIFEQSFCNFELKDQMQMIFEAGLNLVVSMVFYLSDLGTRCYKQ